MELITVTVICLLPIPFDAFVVAIEQGSIDEFSVVFPDFACYYRYDLVDLTRQVLSKLANQVYLDAVTAFRQNNASALTLQSQKFMELIKDVNTLLASDDNFLLGTWLESAKKLATSESEMRLVRTLYIASKFYTRQRYHIWEL